MRLLDSPEVATGPSPSSIVRRRTSQQIRGLSHLVACVAATGLLLAACAGAGDGSAAALDTTVEFVLARAGGLCVPADGDAALCELMLVVRDDGTWEATGNQPPAPAEGAVAAGAASRLAAVVESGWEALTARPFTGTCPSAYDGQEVWYAVRRLPTGPGAELADAVVREVRSCTYDLEHTEARRVLQQLEELWREFGLPG
jgi:hypothetical protein